MSFSIFSFIDVFLVLFQEDLFPMEGDGGPVMLSPCDDDDFSTSPEALCLSFLLEPLLRINRPIPEGLRARPVLFLAFFSFLVLSLAPLPRGFLAELSSDDANV